MTQTNLMPGKAVEVQFFRKLAELLNLKEKRILRFIKYKKKPLPYNLAKPMFED